MLEANIIVLRRYGLGIFLLGFVCVSVAFVSPAWIVIHSDLINPVIRNVGLFYHCSTIWRYPDKTRMTLTSTCRVHWQPFREGYGIEFVQYFFSFCFFGCVASLVLIVMQARYSSPWQKPIVKLRRLTVSILFTSGLCGILATIVFPSTDSTSTVMRYYDPRQIIGYSRLGYSFVFAIMGSCLLLIAGTMLFVEIHMRNKNEQSRRLNETQPQVQLIADT